MIPLGHELPLTCGTEASAPVFDRHYMHDLQG